MSNEIDDLRAKIDALDDESRSLGRPTLAVADIVRIGLGRLSPAPHDAAVAAWRAVHPEAAARFDAVGAEVAAAKQALVRAELLESERGRSLDVLAGMGVGRRHLDTLKAPDASVPLDGARRWLAADSWCLLLLGGPGTGKTLAAAWAAFQTLVTRKRVVWLRAPEQAREPLFGDVAARFTERCRLADMLVVDDVGAEYATDAWRGWLGDILDSRYAANRRTLLSTNLALESLKEHLGARVADRLSEGAMAVACGMESRRKLRVAP